MKTTYIKSAIILVLLVVATKFNAQETVNIPLTDTNKPVFLKIGIINGSISIKGTSTKEVIVKGTKREDDSHNHHHKRKKDNKKTSGMKRISNNSLDFSAEEYENNVRVSSSVHGTTDFEIEVPVNTSLKVSTVNRGDIYVENINGAIDVSNINGKITMKNISGSVSADALNKDILVTFNRVTPNTPMAFSSMNGDIDITFPKDFKADVKVKSDRGEIFTDFDLKTKPNTSTITKDENRRGNAYRVKVERWITGAINGGGAEVLFKNFNGDVIIRAK